MTIYRLLAPLRAATAMVCLGLLPAATAAAETPEHRYTNRLIDSDAPYLLLHAHNPVDWYPWGPEAFAKARAQDKLIFLSVGYSTCFWCHVAERTLYADPDIAALMNRFFINVKVDREQRPDVDRAYMLARQIISGSGGWPNNVFLTPDLKAFYAGSYFAPERDEHGRPSFSEVLRAVHDAWIHRRDKVLHTASQVEVALRRVQEAARPDVADVSVEAEAWKNGAILSLLRRFDPLQGGFSASNRATKFPRAPVLTLLLAEYRASRDASVGEAVTQTLDAIALGGIQDHLAGGFHRYSTDPDWSVPHFEKMLYDNAQLLRVYAEAHEIFATPLYADTARRVALYLTTRMMAPDGAFYTAEDAQVDGVEGASYVWSEGQLEEVLGTDGANALLEVYSLEPVPHSPAARRAAGAPIPEDGGVLRVRRPVSEALEATGATDTAELLRSFEPARRALLAQRDRRKAPLRDEKIVVGLNGLAIDGFAVAGRALRDPAYVAIAERAAQALWDAAFDGATGTLSHQVFRGRPGGDAMLGDYGQFARGLLSLHAVTGDQRWHVRAQRLMDVVVDRFLLDSGQLRVSLASAELPIEPTDSGDVDAPSGTSAALDALAGLAGTSSDGRYVAAAARVLVRLAPAVRAHPDAWPALLTTLPDPRAKPVLAAAKSIRGAAGVAALKTTRDFVRVTAQADNATGQVEVVLHITEGYHVNANPATLEFLIPTRVDFSAAPAADISYPVSRKFKPGFTDTVLDVYERETRIVARFDPDEMPSLAGSTVTVTAQACNDTVCLPPARFPVTVEH